MLALTNSPMAPGNNSQAPYESETQLYSLSTSTPIYHTVSIFIFFFLNDVFE